MKITKYFLLIIIFSTSVYAEVSSFGGSNERFKGKGDRIPPECSLELPDVAGDSFIVKWNCSDDDTEYQDIVTELWMYKKGSESSELVKSFLGFPAAAVINSDLLRGLTVSQSLPLGFRLRAVDRAGNSTISETMYIKSQSASLSKCDLRIVQPATVAIGGATGLPQTELVVKSQEIMTQQISSGLIIESENITNFSSCEVDHLCEKQFDRFTLSLSDDTMSSGILNLYRNDESIFSVKISGSPSYLDESNLSAISLLGTGIIDDRSSSVSLSCYQ